MQFLTNGGKHMLKKVAAINDMSGIGKCSLTVAIPILSALKHNAVLIQQQYYLVKLDILNLHI